MTSVTRMFKFDSAHHLDNYQGACANVHGHSWHVAITVIGTLNESGMIIDFKKLKSIVKTCVIDRLDHKYLNNVLPFNPTAENIAKWIYQEVGKALEACGEEGVKIDYVRLWENYPECYVDYYE